MAKVLSDAGIRLNGVVSDLHGVAARAMIDCLLGGGTPEQALAHAGDACGHRRKSCLPPCKANSARNICSSLPYLPPHQGKPPYELGISFSNRRSPSVGSLRGEVYAAMHSLLGFGDSLSARYGFTEGLDDIGAAYSFPLTARDNRLWTSQVPDFPLCVSMEAVGLTATVSISGS